MDKLKTLAELRRIAASDKPQGKPSSWPTAVSTFSTSVISGISGGRQIGDLLVVALNSDRSVRRLKGPGRPILPQEERADILSSFWFVDFVTIFGQPIVNKVLMALKPDFHVKGSDYTLDTVPEREAVKKYGGRVAIVGGPKIKNTSDIIRRISLLKNG